MSGAGASVADCSAVAGEPVVIGAATLHMGDCQAVLPTLPPASIDAVVCDPPYHLTTGKKGGTGIASVNLDSPAGRARITAGFMGKSWDGGDVAFRPEIWAEVLRVLKPGGYLIAFGGTRTYHRLVCAIEDAGFDIRDQIGWAFGSGFPKSRDIAKYDLSGAEAEQWAGWGTALKPAWEPVVLARAPLSGTVAANLRAHGLGALNIDGCRIAPTGESRARTGEASQCRRYDDAGGTNFAALPGPRGGDPSGRWPANLIHDGSAEVVALFPAEAGAAAPVRARGGDKFRTTYGAFKGDIDEAGSTFHGDTGSAARFFYCAKASRDDRDDGCDSLAKRPLHWSSGEANPGSFQSPGTDKAARNHHPTVKPTDLMRYLCRLITPPGGVVLDPFMGSGSTGRGALLEGFRFVGIEREADYFAIAQARIAAVQGQGDLFAAGPSP